MTSTVIRNSILAFAQHLNCATAPTADAVARSKGWLDENGQPTVDGHVLYEALMEQRATRSTMRLAV